MAAYLIDYHLHTGATIDGRMDENSACLCAIQHGISEIAFTNHVMLNQPDYMIAPEVFIQHWENIKSCQERYPQLKIRLGIEMDYYPEREADIASKIEAYEGLIGQPFDFVMGAVHDIRGGFFSNKVQAVQFFKERDLLSTYIEYFDLERRAVKSHLFNIIAHPDLIKKYTYQLTPFIPFDSYRDAAELFISELVHTGVGIEINTKGVRQPIHETYPSAEFLEMYIRMCKAWSVDPIITIGSDAHKIDDVGFGIHQALETLQKQQVAQITRFVQRKSYQLNL